MRLRVIVLLLIALTTVLPDSRVNRSASTPASPARPSPAAAQLAQDQAYGKLPLSYEQNNGQADASVNFVVHTHHYLAFVSPDALTVAVPQGPATATNATAAPALPQQPPLTGPQRFVQLRLVGANLHASAQPSNKLPGIANYFLGNDPSKWQTNIPTFAQVTYDEAYPGIAVRYGSDHGQVQQDFVVAAGADPGQLAFTLAGATALQIQSSGDLTATVGKGTLRLSAPVVYQEIAGVREPVAAGYQMLGQQVGFWWSDYDPTQPLIIDPTLGYSTYLGGASDDQANAIALDGSDNAYVTGWTTSTNFPTTPGAYLTTFINTGYSDAFVTKLNAGGTALVFSTYFGGSSGNAIAVDSAGDSYIVGGAVTPFFPTSRSATPPKPGASITGTSYVTKLNSTGTALVYTYLIGGSSYSVASAIAIDSSGNAYVAGSTSSSDMPTTTGAFQTTYNGAGGGDAFVAKVNASGSALVYSTYLGGSTSQQAYGIAIDASGNAFVAGETYSPDFPITAGAFQTTYGGNTYPDAFVTKLNASGSALVYSTYLGGSANDYAYAIAIDSNDNAYITGQTLSYNFPTTPGAYVPGTSSAPISAFVTKLNASGSALAYSTLVSPPQFQQISAGRAIAVDSSGNATIVGFTPDDGAIVTTDATQPFPGGRNDGFLEKVNATGSGLLFSTYLGGNSDDYGYGLALDSAGNAYVVGKTDSANFPITAGAFQTDAGGVLAFEAFVTKFAYPAEGAPTITGLSPNASSTAESAVVTITGTNFTGANSVLFGSLPASTYTVNSPTSITATSPGGYGTVDVVVTTPMGVSAITSADQFTYLYVNGGRYYPLVPTRILDTRTSHQTLAAGATLTLPVAGHGGVPASGVTAVVLNVTVTDTTAPSYLTVWPDGVSRPVASNLNWTSGMTIANLVETNLGSTGAVALYNAAGSADVIVDVEGYVGAIGAAKPHTAAPGLPGMYNPLPPTRILDTRPTSQVGPYNTPFTAGGIRTVQITGQGGVPSSGVSAVVLNVTVTDTTAPSYLTVWPSGVSQPLASNLNWPAGTTIPNRVIVPVGAAGQIAVYNAAGAADVILDVNGWFTDSTAATGYTFTGTTPTRIMDTRASSQVGPYNTPFGPGTVRSLNVIGIGGVPSSVRAVVLNVTVTDTTAPSYLSVYSGDLTSPPVASDLNWTSGTTIPNLVVVQVGFKGPINIYNAAGNTDVIIDVVGWYS